MTEVDFLFIYEVKSRELESICLLKYELERLGYTVALINTWYFLERRIPDYNAKVIVTSALYNNETFKFMSTYTKKMSKVINMQWEQIGSNDRENHRESLFYLKGVARDIPHICWGENTIQRLEKNCKIARKNLMLTGHISLDFLRNELLGYYKDKDEIFSKYNIPRGKKVCLFISSFSHVNLPDEVLTDNIDNNDNELSFTEVSKKSQSEIIKWITKILEKDNDILFIYRPHPSESNNSELEKITDKHSNFFIVSELSVKQWILISDKVYTWVSTSIIEVYASGKDCHILRPVDIPKGLDMSIYNDANFIESFDSFEESIVEKMDVFPIKEEVIKKYYYLDKSEPVYKKIVDAFLKVYNDDFYFLPLLTDEQKLTIREKLGVFVARSRVNKIINYLSVNTNLKIPILEGRRKKQRSGYNKYKKNLIKNNFSSDEEINQIVKTISDLLN